RTPRSILFPYTTLFRSMRVHTKGLLRIHCLEDVCVGLLTPGRHVDRVSATEISAPRSRFLDGLCKTQGYNVVSEGERITVAFEPDRKSTRLNSSHVAIS